MNRVRAVAFVELLLAGFAAADATAQTRTVAVGPAHFDGEVTPSTDLSGIACDEPESGRRLCLAVDDQTSFAQWATLEDGRLSPGGHVSLDPTELRPDDVVESRCFKGVSDKGDVDGEAVAYLAPYWYVIGSHGCSRKKNQFSAAAFRVYRVARGSDRSDASTARVAIALRTLPETSAFAERCLQQANDKKGRPVCAPGDPANGVNVEGMAATPGSLYVGLRGPSRNGEALVLRFDLSALFDPAAVLAAPEVHRLEVGSDLGVRDLAALPDGRLLLLSGPAREDRLPYGLYVVLPDGTLQPLSGWTPKPAKAETVAVVSANATRATLLVMYDGLEDGEPELVEVALPPTSGTPSASITAGVRH